MLKEKRAVKAAILYNQFFDHDGDHRVIGGVETYLYNLAGVCRRAGIGVTIYQYSNVPFVKVVDNFLVKGIPVRSLPERKRRHALFSAAAGEMEEGRDIVIFGADTVSVPTKNRRHISIQHGVGWDLDVQDNTDRRILQYSLTARIRKWLMARDGKRNYENCMNTVCVDYNFMNWYRNHVMKERAKRNVWVIPNFSRIAPADEVRQRDYSGKNIRILFARRFVKIRGTRLIVDVAGKLIGKYPEISFTFAGEGPDEYRIRAAFAGEKRVRIIKYAPEESQFIHLRHDIAVVPSIASEGTSLSVVEAMATGCPVVATAVGGITNMIISGYNGILTMPRAPSVLEGIEMLIKKPEKRREFGERAYETAREAFSFERWEASWREVLNKLQQSAQDMSEFI